ncbi:unnamed protein product, partial [marine sediment metagenome]
TKVVWDTYDLCVYNNTVSSAFQLRTLDVNNANATVTGAVTFNLDGGSGGKFYGDTGCSNQIITAPINASESLSGVIYYRNTNAGTTAYATAVDLNGTWTEANQSVAVSPTVQLWGGGSIIGNYTTIAAAEAAAVPYDTIKVLPGTYQPTSTITIDVPHLTLQSTGGAATTIINGSALSTVFTIAANNATLGGDGTGLTINGTVGTTTAIKISKAGGISDVTIQDNTLTNNSKGINVLATGVVGMNATNITINGNTITVSRTSTWTEGIVFGADEADADKLCNSLITENTISNCSEGISLYAVNNTVISNNTVPDCRYTGIAIDRRAGTDTNNVTISGNTVTNVTGDTWSTGIAVDKRGSVHGCTANVSNITLTGNTVTGCTINIAFVREPDGTPISTPNLGTITVLHNNILSSKEYGLYNNNTVTLDATLNWWGNVTGPSAGTGTHASSAIGSGDAVSTYVTYSPWLSAAYPGGNSTTNATFSLKSNWNFMSVPKKLENATFGWLLSGISFTTAWGYNAS